MPKKNAAAPLSSEDKLFFQKFYEEYKGFLFYIARQYAPSDCEDIVQETILRLLNNLESLKPLNQNQTAKYIALTVKSSFLDMEKRRRGNQELALDDTILEALMEKEASFASTADLGMELSELKHSLSARDWLILEGKYILGYSQEELAQLIGVSPDSVRMILSRARAKARSILLTGSESGGEGNE